MVGRLPLLLKAISPVDRNDKTLTGNLSSCYSLSLAEFAFLLSAYLSNAVRKNDASRQPSMYLYGVSPVV